eukprot:5568161-Pyramimonas_sp.AAC.1
MSSPTNEIQTAAHELSKHTRFKDPKEPEPEKSEDLDEDGDEDYENEDYSEFVRLLQTALS